MAAERDIVVIGASAGGLPALEQLLHWLPADFPAAVFLVLHRAATFLGQEVLSDILSRNTSLRLVDPYDGQRIEPGRLYVASSDKHLLLTNGAVRLEHSPKESHFRPSINVLFRSAATVYGRRVIGLLLSGLLDDGTAGLWQIKKCGGVAIVQDPAEAAYPSMPLNAIGNVEVDYVLPISAIPPKIIALARPEERTKSQPKVLLVEDERLVAKNLEAGLQELGYTVSGSVATGEGAIQCAREQMPDVVLMDIRLEGPLTGIHAAREIWESLQIPIVYLTAYADSETLRNVKTTECYGYLLKPFHTAAVHAAIQLALDRREREMRHQ